MKTKTDHEDIIKIPLPNLDKKNGLYTFKIYIMKGAIIDKVDAAEFLKHFIKGDFLSSEIAVNRNKYFTKLEFQCTEDNKDTFLYLLNQKIKYCNLEYNTNKENKYKLTNIATALLLIVLIISIQGFLSEYYLLKKFNLNIATFASADYFFTAGISFIETSLLKYFFSILEFILPTFFIIIVLYLLSSVLFTKSRMTLWGRDLKGATEFIYPFAILFLFFFSTFGFFTVISSPIKGAERKYNSIISSKEIRSHIKLKENNHMLSNGHFDFSLITVTDVYMIFYQHSNGFVLTIPIENISAVSFSKNNLKSSQKNLNLAH